jgi:hypothetical protein
MMVGRPRTGRLRDRELISAPKEIAVHALPCELDMSETSDFLPDMHPQLAGMLSL